MTECGVDKPAYLSRAVADNAVTLHLLSAPDCRKFAPYPCGDHFHVGHKSKAAGTWCKAAHPFHRPTHD